MRKVSAGIIGLCLLLSGCIQGPAGEDGEDGADQRIYIRSGVLYPADLEDNTTNLNGYWDISYFAITDSSIVDVLVRQGAGFMWQHPVFYVSTTNAYVRISNNSFANYEYRIIVSKAGP